MTAPTPSRTPASGRDIALAAIADVAVVILFAAVGRASHGEDPTPWGVGMTALPFLVALAVGWLATLAWRAPLAPARTGLPIWAIAVAGGMLGRVLLGEGTALPFVIVATLTLLVLLVGWRLLARGVRRARNRAR